MADPTLTPEQQAEMAARIGALEDEIAKKTRTIQELRARPDTKSVADRQAVEIRLEVNERDRTKAITEANVLRAQLGLPLVVPSAVPDLPVVSLPAASHTVTTEAPKSTGGRDFGGLVVAVVIVVGVLWYFTSGITKAPDTPSYEAPAVAPASSKPSVTYYVTGSASSVSVTYQNGTGGTEQRDAVSLPWNATFDMDEGDFVYLAAQNQGDSGTVTCSIRADGQLVKQSTSTGAYVIASCSGSVP
jgi:hypothetical protein